MRDIFECYPEYVKIDSEILSSYPSKWTLARLKHVSSIKGRIGFRGYTVNDIVDEGQGAITLSPSNIVEGKLNLDKKTYVSWDKYYESPEIMVNIQDIIFCKTGSSYGKSTMVQTLSEPMTINPQLVIIKPNSIVPKYLAYLMESSFIKDQVELIVGGGTMPTISQEAIMTMNILIPSVDEQIKVNRFLDNKCEQIEQLIKEKNKLIGLLEEKRQSMITEVVTKGLNPNVQMNDLHDSWIPQIPDCWGISKVSYYSKVLTGGTPDKSNDTYWLNGSINWMASGEVNKEFIFEVESKITEEGLANSNARMLPLNTVMIALNGQGKTKGKVAVLQVETTCNQSLAGFICDEANLHYLYLYYFLKSKYKEVRGLVGDGLRDGLSIGILKSLKIPLPSINEQLEIASFLKFLDNEISCLIKGIEESIFLLKEYRQSLIYEAVTGKIDVRDFEVKA
ncbi:TPA: restriction endonuclease subunit S [Bacillus cereus]